ncbi:MAG: alpha/beta hydrolase fold domain-containing protein [Bdellovibrionota bacterium]
MFIRHLFFWILAAITLPSGASIMTPSCEENALLKAAQKTSSLEDVTYCTHHKDVLKVDIISPANAQTTNPALLFIHGGAWSQGDKKEWKGIQLKLAGQGFVTFSLNYRLNTKDDKGAVLNSYSDQIEDIQCALRWIYKNRKKYKVNPKRMGIAGSSSGAHLALLAGLTLEGNDMPSIKAIVSVSGPTDLDALQVSNPKLNSLLEKVFRSVDHNSSMKKASPVTYLKKESPPILSLSGTLDNVVPFDQAERLDREALKVGAKHTLIKFDNEGHRFSEASRRCATTYLINFFKKILI